MGLARGAGEFRYIAARGHQTDFRVGELLGGLGALLCGQIARDAAERDRLARSLRQAEQAVANAATKAALGRLIAKLEKPEGK